ncbi:MAG: hypothetical protein M3R72_07005, partial [Bacteroidota bacterium]|nr:hypothetical protein [Bacteroidota bacterium]
LFTDSIVSPALIEIAKTLLDSGRISPLLLKDYIQPIVKLAQQYCNRLKVNPFNYDYSDYTLLDVLSFLNTTSTNAALQNWLAIKKSPYLQIHAAGHLLQNNQTVNTTVWQNLAANKATRTRLYDTLQAYKKETFFPKEYLKQRYFAESHIYAAASEDEEPSTLTYLTQKVIYFNNKPARFYFYNVTYGDGDNATHSLVGAGPFEENVSRIHSKKAFGEIYAKENFDPNNLSAQMDNLIKQMEERPE